MMKLPAALLHTTDIICDITFACFETINAFIDNGDDVARLFCHFILPFELTQCIGGESNR
jgi:hypothetical protein